MEGGGEHPNSALELTQNEVATGGVGVRGVTGPPRQTGRLRPML